MKYPDANGVSGLALKEFEVDTFDERPWKRSCTTDSPLFGEGSKNGVRWGLVWRIFSGLLFPPPPAKRREGD